jgi:hypothetical protein
VYDTSSTWCRWAPIEQAKGMLAERLQVSMPDAFESLRSYARAHNQRLTELARALIDQTIATIDLAAFTSARSATGTERPPRR